MSATNYSESARVRMLVGALALLCCGSALAAVADTNTAVWIRRAEQRLADARARLQAQPADATNAWQFGRAGFDLAEFATTDRERARLAQESIDVLRPVVAQHTNLAPAHYYLAMNLGQLARTKGLGALGLVGDMEALFHKTVALDPKFDYAGANRCLGLLFLDAPGWPISVGSRAKARQHLQRAVELCPEFPENQLCLVEARLKWGEKTAAHHALKAIEAVLDAAKQKFTGDEWEPAWADWQKRWAQIQKRAKETKPGR